MSKKIAKNTDSTATATATSGATRGRKPGGTNFLPFKISDLTALVGKHTDAEIQVSTKWLRTFQSVFPAAAVTAARAGTPETSETAEFKIG